MHNAHHALLEIVVFQNPTSWVGTGQPQYIFRQNPRVSYPYWFGCAYVFRFWVPSGSDLDPTKQHYYMDAGPARAGSASVLDWISICPCTDPNPTEVPPPPFHYITAWYSTMTHHEINHLMVIRTMQLSIGTWRDSSYIILYLENYSELQL